MARFCIRFLHQGRARLGTLERVDARGLFEGAVSGPRQPLRYRAKGQGAEWTITDPYSFGPVLGPLDDLLIGEGTHFRLFDKLGAHLIEHEGASGVHFAVWAPNAQRVALVGDFNDWNGRPCRDGPRAARPGPSGRCPCPHA